MDNKTMFITVEGATKFDFTDEKTGRRVQGVNIFHLTEGSGENAIGKIPSKITLGVDHWEYISKMKFPSTCEVVIDYIFTNKGIKTKVAGLKPKN